MREHGTVKWFDPRKGFGFIARAEGDDVFVHHSGIRTRGNVHRHLVEGEEVEFSCETWEANTGSRTRAADVRHRDHADGAMLSCEESPTAPGAWAGPPRNINIEHAHPKCGWRFENKSEDPTQCILVDKAGKRWRLTPAEESEATEEPCD